MPENRGKKLEQGFPANGRIHVKPRAIGGNPHIEVAAKGRIPQVNRGQAPGLVRCFLKPCNGLLASLAIVVIMCPSKPEMSRKLPSLLRHSPSRGCH